MAINNGNISGQPFTVTDNSAVEGFFLIFRAFDCTSLNPFPRLPLVTIVHYICSKAECAGQPNRERLIVMTAHACVPFAYVYAQNGRTAEAVFLSVVVTTPHSPHKME